MIRKVKFSNFYSFENEQEISFLANKKSGYDYNNSKSGDQISKIAGFVGKNASGKTNIMRFFSFFSYFVCRNIDEDSVLLADIAYKTFFNNEKTSNFYVEFEKNNVIFFYSFSIKKNEGKNEIVKELLEFKEIKKYAQRKEVFSRNSNEIILNKDYFKNISNDKLPKIKENISFITFIKKSIYSVDIIESVYDYFSNFRSNINEIGQINHPRHQVGAIKTYLENSNLKKEMEKFICNFDIGLDGFDFNEKVNDNNEISISIEGIHHSKGKKNKLDFIYESRGTKSLFFVIANILSGLKNNSIILIDEIESGLHPEALNKLISYFIDENENGTAQLIFSSHSLEFMNKLDMHQIYLVDKDKNNSSFSYRLNEVARTDENFLSKYMSGKYGAFPEIRV